MQEYGGISRYICSLANALSQNSGVEARMFAPLHINAYLAEMPPELAFEHKIQRIPKTGRMVSAISQILSVPMIKNYNPSIVHETYYALHAYAPKSARRVVTVYDMIHELFASEFPAHDQTSKLKRVAAERADHVICISENTRRDLLDIFNLPEDKVSVVYLGFDSLALDTNKLEHKEGKPYLLYVGQRWGYKNFAGFLQAYASSSFLRNHFDVVCFGGGVFTNDELNLFAELGLSKNQVSQISGSDSKLASFYSNAALFVYPSLYEGFGIPPLEAMSLGCPVACANNSSIPEVAGNSAEYFNAGNPDSIRVAMEHVVNSNSRRDELINLGKLRCAEFSWQRCASETLAVYRNLI
ncbi:MAG: glycosyltransferase family 1 protein [Methylotenera sp.]|nr:glycosyltransferase family 1 protein [Methylotenera sp.]MDZ4223971.1 glycosyltransferase family 1 protein [Methylotenera sp.]